MQIPNITGIMPGETIFSYLTRLAERNGLDLYTFMDAYVWPNIDYDNTKTLRFDSFEPLYSLFDALSLVDHDRMQFFKEHTIYPAIAPFITSANQLKYIQTVFRKPDEYSELVADILSLGAYLNICPECAKEDEQQHGFRYFHREHQIPGVCVCSKHHVPLLQSKPDFRRRYEYSEYSPMVQCVTEAMIAYAMFVNSLLDSDLSCNKETIDTLIREHIVKSFYDGRIISDKYEAVAESMKNNVISPYLKDIQHTLHQVCSKRKGSISDRIAMLFITCNGDISKLRLENDSLREEFFSYLGMDELIGPYNENGVTIRHKCGDTYQTTPFGYIAGWNCPHCATQSKEKLFYTLFRNVSGEEYTLQSEYDGLKEPITCRHKKCGESFETTPYKFLYDDHRCACRTVISQKDLKQRCADSGFVLLEAGKLGDAATLKCTRCKTIFRVEKLKLFLNHPFCRQCESERFRSVVSTEERTEHFLSKVKEQVGDEYTVLSPYETAHTKVEIRHEECGGTFSIRPDAFFIKGKCPCCKKKKPFIRTG